MSMQDIMQALMQSGSGGTGQSSGGADALSQVVGGLLGGGQHGSTTQGGGGMLSQLLGGLLGGGQQTSSAGGVGQLLGGLQQIIGGTPGTGQQLPLGGGNMNISTGDPIMSLLQPVVNQLAAKAGISPQMATIIASIAVHYLLQSHPSTPGASPLNLGNVMQTLASGGKIDPQTMQSSGIVNDVMQTTGMNQQQAMRSLNTTFSVLGTSVKGSGGKPAAKRAKRKK